jgi:hypothetical protein
MRMTGRGRVCDPGGPRWLAVVTAALAACGVVGAFPSVALAGSAAVPTWTRQHPATSPPAQSSAAMAYDAATGTVVLFGSGETWTWDGTTWTRQHPATSPAARADAGIASDAATGNVVMFGGSRGGGVVIGDTWTWG